MVYVTCSNYSSLPCNFMLTKIISMSKCLTFIRADSDYFTHIGTSPLPVKFRPILGVHMLSGSLTGR